MNITKIATSGLLFISLTALAQTGNDSIQQLPDVTITEQLYSNQMNRLPQTSGTLIYAGKKNEVIKLGTIDADLSVNNSRQVFGKVPGLSVWENDGSGIQIGISTRGLSPNRSWEFNVRQNGTDITGEVFGYPESYFNPPLESIERIEIIRGAASLQFGPQFGGLLNYVVKKGDPNKIISFETQQTTGTFGLYNSYNAFGGTYKKWSYYTYFHYRSASGWRENNQYKINTGYASLNYALSDRINIGLQYTKTNYISKQPGGLTDSMFNENAQQSIRERNWFSAPWNVSQLYFNYEINSTTKLNIKLFNVTAERNSVGFTKALNVADTFNTAIGSYNLRQVDRDWYNNSGAEIRFLKSYNLLKQQSSLALGVRYYNGTVERKQLGVGTTDFDFDLSLTQNTWGRDLNFKTQNIAFYLENIFKIGNKLSIVPGIRYEIINSGVSGYINTSSTGTLPDNTQSRSVLLMGSGAEFKVNKASNVYANFSQSFRPVLYSELTPSSTSEIVDPNIKDATGYNIDFGYRGNYKNIVNWDVGLFYLHYNNRIGTITQNNAPFRTNIGTSVSQGAEVFVEVNPLKFIKNGEEKFGRITLFTSFGYIDAKYTRWDNPAIANDPTKSILNKRVENAPNTIGRYGITYVYKKLSATFQINQVGEVYADAANTDKPNATATTGKIPAYSIMDGSVTFLFGKIYNLKAGVNNIADTRYFTRRSGGYPGPGLMPGNGRTIFISIGARI
jgi:Fe(3+) dicitrate transport protein